MTNKKPTKSRFAIYRDRKAAELLALKEELALKEQEAAKHTKWATGMLRALAVDEKRENEQLEELTILRKSGVEMVKLRGERDALKAEVGQKAARIFDLGEMSRKYREELQVATRQTAHQTELLAKEKKSAKRYRNLCIAFIALFTFTSLAGLWSTDRATQEADRWKRNSVAISSAYDTLAKQERWDTVMPPDLQKRMVLTYGFRQDSVWRSYDTGQEVTVLKWRPKQ